MRQSTGIRWEPETHRLGLIDTMFAGISLSFIQIQQMVSMRSNTALI